jgi:hypothetical protein
MGSLYRRGQVWWIKFYRKGKPIRESAGTPKQSEARRLLRRCEGEAEEGKPHIPHVTRVRLAELLDDVLTDYRVNGKPSLARAELSVSHLKEYFALRRVVDLGTRAVRQYIARRQSDGARNATINRGSPRKRSRGPSPEGSCSSVASRRRVPSSTWPSRRSGASSSVVSRRWGDLQAHLLTSAVPHDGLRKLRREIERVSVPPVLEIVNPLPKFIRLKDDCNYAELTAELEPFLSLARETGVAVVACHHVGKGERSAGDEVLGSTAIFGAVDTLLVQRRYMEKDGIASLAAQDANIAQRLSDLEALAADRAKRAGGLVVVREQGS